MDAIRGGADPDRGITVPPEAARKEAFALLVLRELPDVGFVTIERLIDAFGSAREALAASPGAFAAAAGRGPEQARRSGDARAEARRVLERGEELDVRPVPRGSRPYPTRLYHLAQPPPLLFLKGREELLDRPIVSIVGSRKSTGRGRRVAAEAARVLCARGAVVASGLALGIDAAAHRATLEAGGDTVAVLGCGADVGHPPSNRGLQRRIGREGLLVTEFPLGTQPRRHHFPQRNRILAALAQGVLVVEAGAQSGALITAQLAGEIGRTIMAVPGSVYSDRSRGTNRLLKDGAVVLSQPEDVLELLDRPRVEQQRLPLDPVGLGQDASALWAAMEDDALGVDDLTRRAGLGPGRTLPALAELELGGWVERVPGMRFVRRHDG